MVFDINFLYSGNKFWPLHTPNEQRVAGALNLTDMRLRLIARCTQISEININIRLNVFVFELDQRNRIDLRVRNPVIWMFGNY